MCALRLAEAGFDNILILEAETRVGGRILTIPKNGKWLELGAQWIHGKGQNPLWKFVQKHKVIKAVQVSVIISQISDNSLLLDSNPR